MGITGDRDEAWYEGVVSTYRPVVVRVLARSVGRDVAEDLAQQTFLEAWRARDRVPDEPLPWLFAVARRRNKDHWRGFERIVKLRVRLWLEQLSARSVGASAEVGFWPDFVRACMKLSRIEREVIMYDADGLTSEQIGQIVGASAVTVRKRLSRAHHKLRRALGDNEVAHPRDKEQARTGGPR